MSAEETGVHCSLSSHRTRSYEQQRHKERQQVDVSMATAFATDTEEAFYHEVLRAEHDADNPRDEHDDADDAYDRHRQISLVIALKKTKKRKAFARRTAGHRR